MEKNKILIVDDDANLRKTLEDILRMKGYEPIGANSGQAAIETIQQQSFPIALIDLKLEDMPGLDVLKKITQTSPQTECIILTGFASTESAIESINLGAYSYIQKPYEIDQLLLTIQRALERKASARALSDAEMRYNQIYNNSSDGIVSGSLKGDFHSCNTAFLKMTGYEPEEVRKMSLWDITPQEWHERERNVLETQLKNRDYSTRFEKELIRKDGSVFPVELTIFLVFDDNGNPDGMWAFVRDITARIESEKKLRRQLNEITVLQELTAASLTANSINELFETTTNLLAENIFPDLFGIVQYDADTNTLRHHPSFVDHSSTANKLNIWEGPADSGLCGRVIRTKQAQLANNVNEDPDYIAAVPETKSELCVPILINNEIFGLIDTQKFHVNGFTKKDLKLLVSLANQLAASIEKVRLRQKEDQHLKELTALYETSLTTSSIMEPDTLYERLYGQLVDLFPLDSFMLVEVEPGNDQLHVSYIMENGEPLQGWVGNQYNISEGGLIGWVIRNKKPFLCCDLQHADLPVESPHTGNPSNSWLGVPLISKGKVIGGMSVQSFNKDAFNENHQRLLQSLAAQIASAIDNATLLKTTQRQIERLSALHDIDLVINSSLDLRVTLNILLDQVIEKLEVEAAAVMLLNPDTQTLEYTASRGFRSTTIRQYKMRLDENTSGKSAMEHHLVQAFNLNDLEGDFAYTKLMAEENFTSYHSVPLMAKGQVKGVLDIFNSEPINPDQDWYNFLETLAGQAAIAIDNTGLLEDLHRSNVELTLAYDTTLEGWSKALDLRDEETEGHTLRVSDLTVRMARAFDIADDELIHIRRGAILHDIGKMGVPDAILLKPGKLTPDEWKIMRKHPIYAYEMLSPIAYLKDALDIPYCHHERWDGTGYPRQLRGKQIPLAARIFAVIDVWDALTSDRPYRKAWTNKKTLAYIRNERGKHFDPQVLDVFLEWIKNDLIDDKSG